ncbi:FAD-binding oxidoreductase [Streptomyces malaysiensis subsp. malaysiensis]|uniref:FAD-binding oxidoreductase n=2 Tax=Streptomyces malaysiensis TaxID=92644 RepID=A0ABX6WI89_STRMQ|nr:MULTISPECIES: FAD-dependent oxidoreductase [Streptomyces]QPI61172.1 FAD-binding oxidoreductase [Streptomyces solisilvae]UHH22930.1 FAD-binding oxidoreductase [Streptomyces sp. HNM0561]
MHSAAIVIGAGVMGTSIALELAKSGYRVRVVDKGRAIGHGSTSASSAVVRFNFSTWSGVATAWESRFHWENWAEHLGTDSGNLAEYVRCGLVFLDVDVAPRSLYLPLFDDVGVPYEQWDADRLAEEVSGVDNGRYWPPKRLEDPRFWDDAADRLGAVHTPDAGYVSDPQLAAANLAEAAARHGATFLLGKAVVEVVRRGGRVGGVVLDDGTRIDADIVVNAAGPWSGRVNQLAGAGGDFAVSLRPLRQEVHHIPPAAAGGVRAPRAMFADIDLGIYARPEVGGGVLVGGTEPECDPFQWAEDPDAVDLHVTSDLFNAQVTRAARRFSQVAVPNRPRGIVGVYDVSDDWIPVYDKTDVPGFYVAIGTSGNQFKNAPLVGKFMAAIIEYCELGGDHDAEPVTFTGTYCGHRIDLSAFSRLRRAGGHTTGTVMG